MRRLLLPAIAALVIAACATPASAAVRFRPCPGPLPVLCGTVAVPIDRSGAVRGAIRLHVRRIPALERRRGAVVALAGGPGQSATPFTGLVAELFGNILRTRDLIVLDQRGTGRSGLIRCPTLEGLGARTYKVSGAAADCADTLGPRRPFYTSYDSVEDIEAVRRAVGVERITLYGVSYGTKVALAYAAAYPQHVERLVLDSIVQPQGPDPFGLDFIGALPRVLGLLCAEGCKRFTNDATSDLAALVKKLGSGLIVGPVVGPDGRARPSRLGRLRLLDLLAAGDFDPTLRAGLPAAVRSALAGDAAPILRLAKRADGLIHEPVGLFNPAVFVATQCEEGPLAWTRTTNFMSRYAEASTRLSQVPDAAVRPFDRLAAFAQSSVVQFCRFWPTAPTAPPLFARPLPDVPALLLAGEDDLRTPLEGARQVAAALPRATLLPVPDIGHDVLGFDPYGCSLRALRAFFTDRPVKQCRRRPRLLRAEPVAPTSIGQVPPAPATSGRSGRTLAAVERTLEDVATQLTATAFSLEFAPGFGGLRSGTVRFGVRGLVFRGVEYVPGVRLSGLLEGERKVRGFLRVGGKDAAPGRLRLRPDRTLVGRLGGSRVRHRIPPRAVPGPLPAVEELVLTPVERRKRSGHTGVGAGELLR